MQYHLAFSYFYAKQNGLTNILLVTLCLFIPFVGPLVIIGYQAEVTERLIRGPDLRRHPDFSFDRFGELLSRGLWPFLVSLVVVLMAVPLMLVVAFAVMSIGAAADPMLGIILGVLVYFCAILALNVVLIPMQFHAELANRFDLGGGFRFALSFLKLVGGKAVVTYLVFTVLAIPLLMIGLLACVIGYFPAAVVSIMAGQHLMVQLYLDYLDRGGEEIESTPTGGNRRRRRRDEEEYDDYDDDYDRR